MVNAASVSKPNAPPTPKYKYPLSIISVSVCFNLVFISPILSDGIRLCPVKQQVLSIITKPPIYFKTIPKHSLSNYIRYVNDN
jgi:hypothetical protein